MRGRLWVVALTLAGVGLALAIVFIVIQGRPGADRDGEAPGPPEDRASEPEKPEPRIEVTDTEVTVRDEEGTVIWRASFAGEIELDAQGRTARAERVHWRFEGKGFRELGLKAPLMEADYNRRLLAFSEGVSIQAEGGELVFSADAVQYQFDTHKLIGSGQVLMRSGAFLLTGDRLVIDNNTRKVRVRNATLRKER